MAKKRYDFSKIEKKWQATWRKKKVYEPNLKSAKKPFYNLMMFPYPSAEGLHVGNMYAFTGSDIYGRFKRMQGYDVFEPIGLDGFGIHSENYAMKIGTHPLTQSKVSEKRFYKQLEAIGNGFAWNEHLETYDPEYYKWTQWLFARMFREGLAYRKKQAVNWCPSCKTVLADEQVIAGECERCGSKVAKRELEQWFFRITEYAGRLDRNLDKLDWSEKVKVAQRNWIGKSAGAELDFMLVQTKFSVRVFTTRPDTLFGATYLVLAPEHPLIPQLRTRIMNWPEVEKYLEDSKARSEADRLEGKEKTGIQLKGVKAVNPANREEIPVWVADYVLGSYGTGAIMAVPAHDERDHEFAKKFDLPIRSVIEPVTGEPGPGEEFRASIVAVVEDPKTGKFLSINWGDKLGGNLFVGGGREGKEDPAEAALREIREETGYQNLRLISKSETIHHHYFAASKGVRRRIEAVGLHFELVNGARQEQVLEADEKGKFSVEWITKEEAAGKVKDPLHQLVFRRLVEGNIYSGEGRLVNSDKFTGMDSAKAKDAIVKFVRGKNKVRFRLRDWLISRQRYWGPPIPMIHCEACASAGKGERADMPGWYSVPDRDLPVRLPNVKEFRPTGTDQSPLATVESFHKVRCPGCRQWARRETDVSDTFLDSAWYYLRYPNVRVKNKIWDPAILKKWFPVDMYIGGAEHAVLHLLYVRFVAMVLKDWGMIHFEEPFKKFRAHGLLIKEGAKMSKSKGNVVNPDEYIKKFGADTLRMYLMFLAPFEQGGDFRDQGVMGVTRFLERVWKFASGVRAKAKGKETEKVLHATVKKVTEDLELLRYNTAVSALMILLNEMEKAPAATGVAEWQAFLKLLAPFAPHLTEELWQASGGKGSIHASAWPSYNPKLLVEDTFTLVVQVNGKVRASFEASAGITEQEAAALALADPKIQAHLNGADPKRVIYIPKRLVNIVV